MSVSPTGSPSFPSDTSSPLIPSPTGNNNNNNNNNNGGNGNTTSSSLYLFTFLATLLLLLAVSCAIVARSLVVRRRFRRRVEEAIAAGIIPPYSPPPGMGGLGAGRRRADFGEKPQMWDTWIAPGDVKWSNVKPVSVKVISDKLSGDGQVLPKGSTTRNAPSTSSNDNIAQPRRRLLSAIPFPLTYRISPSPAPRTTVSSPTSNTNAGVTPSNTDAASESDGNVNSEPPAYEDAKMQVSVLISMPSPYRPQSWISTGSDGSLGFTSSKGKERSASMEMEGEDELPDVVFGVAEVPWKFRGLTGNTTTNTGSTTAASETNNTTAAS